MLPPIETTIDSIYEPMYADESETSYDSDTVYDSEVDSDHVPFKDQ